MASAAQTKTRKSRARMVMDAHLARRGAEGAAAKASAPRPAAGKAAYQRRKSGLEWLRDKGQITAAQFQAGERYGTIWRTANIGGTESIRSCLDDSVGGGGGVAGHQQDLAAAEWLAQNRRLLAELHQVVGYDPAMTATLDAICGKQMTPREISTVAAEVLEIECTLRLALNLVTLKLAELAKLTRNV